MIRRAAHSNQHHLGDVNAEFLEFPLRHLDRAPRDLGVASPGGRIFGRGVLAATVKGDSRIALKISELDRRRHHPEKDLSFREVHLDATDAR
jgi:hypothetical protein